MVQAPRDLSQRVGFIARLENIEVALGVPRARVVVNARTGSVVMNSGSAPGARRGYPRQSVGGDRRQSGDQSACAAVPGADGGGQRPRYQRESAGRCAAHGRGTASLQEVVDGLNALGATPQDLVSILEALKAAGALRADLEVI